MDSPYPGSGSKWRGSRDQDPDPHNNSSGTETLLFGLFHDPTIENNLSARHNDTVLFKKFAGREKKKGAAVYLDKCFVHLHILQAVDGSNRDPEVGVDPEAASK